MEPKKVTFLVEEQEAGTPVSDLSMEIARLSSFVRSSSEREYPFLGMSKAIKDVQKKIASLSPMDVSILIIGQEGVGRALIAKVMHSRSSRFLNSFVECDCRDFSYEGSIEKFKNICLQASGGSVLFRSLDKLPRNLLGSIFNDDAVVMGKVRIFATITPSDYKHIEHGIKDNFKHTILVPTLSKRKDDILLLAEYFLDDVCERMNIDKPQFSKNALKILKKYNWPGNVLELKKVIWQSVLNLKGEVIEEDDLTIMTRHSVDIIAEKQLEKLAFEEITKRKLAVFLKRLKGYNVSSLHESIIKRVEKPLIELVLEQTGGNKIKAADILGINRNTLHKKVRELKIS